MEKTSALGYEVVRLPFPKVLQNGNEEVEWKYIKYLSVKFDK